MNIVAKHAAKVFLYVITSAAAVSGLAEALEAAGSVKLANTKEILSIQNCDGILVGTASWELESFKEMILIAKKLS